MKKIAVLIPCYNEEKTVAKVVKDFKKQLPSAKIYVYDNNSTDSTAKKAKAAGAIVKAESHQGKGNVVRAMFRDIDADCYLLVDGDDTYQATKAKELCDHILKSNCDMVIGDRLSTSYLRENRRRFHSFGNKLVRFLVNTTFKSDLKDVMSGYRAFSKHFVKSCPVLSRGFEVETEVTIRALDGNFQIAEIPVDYKNRKKGESKLHTFSDGFKVIKTFIRLLEEYRPMLFFGILAIFFSTAALILGIPVLIDYLNTGLVLRFPTLIVAGFLATIALLMVVCGIILKVVTKRHKELFELFLLNKKK